MNDKKVISLSINREIYDAYRQYCESKGLIISKQVENFMRDELENAGVKK